VTILLIRILQLQSFSRMAMVLLMAPLGPIRVVIARPLAKAPLGFVAIALVAGAGAAANRLLELKT
jgi:multidrug efflux pump